MSPPTGSPSAASLGELGPDEIARYSRHLGLAEIGEEGQARLKRSSVLIVGAGGLGSPAALYLAAAGVGRLGIADFDTVDVTNLQRQVLHDTTAIGRRKTDSARERVEALNPLVRVETFDEELTAANALDVIRGYDVVVDGTDNFKTRYLTNDACVLLGRPNVYGSVLRFEGQASVFATPDGPCYRCLFREPPPPGLVPSCAEAGVLGVLPGLVGTIQATEAIKLILGAGDTLAGRLLLIDAWRMRFRTIRVRRDPDCPACGTRELTALIDYDEFCAARPAPANAIPQVAEPPRGESRAAPRAGVLHDITPGELAERLGRGEPLEVIDVREPYEWRIARIDGAQLVPLSRIDTALSQLRRDREIVLYCHHGQRSRMAGEYLVAQGFDRVWNLTGGIARWSAEVDPSVPTY
ncbi:MAG TPA: molybdopterin-synthase adenylyltransferase MoeB [Gemmatimonadaceae bacterium]|jgi:adenylyltransferase/sulfurtransferase|nr:molybdopterin-synthase adenylyltransferase MoeB [Gemmatimonadaceae bacterium]